MMYLILLILGIILFIENRINKNRQIHIHYLCIVLFSLIAFKECNTLLSVILIYWLLRSLRKPDCKFLIKPYLIPLFVFSTVLLLTGIFSFFAVKETSVDLIGILIRNFVIMTFWPIMIAYTIPDILHLRKMVYFYAVVCILEVGVTGMIIYFFYYEDLYLFSNLTDLDISISDLNNPRLISFGSRNSNDAAFILLGAFGLVMHQLFTKFRIKDLILTLTAFFGMLFTWTRSVWVFVLIYLGCFFYYNKKLNAYIIMFFAFFLIIISIVSIQLIEDRVNTDERLQSNENADSRKQQYLDYFLAIPKMPLFWGMYDSPQIISSKLGIREVLSPENYTLQTFLKNGVFAGLTFVFFFVYFIFNFWTTMKTYIRVNKHEKSNTTFVVAVFATFISISLMTQSSFFRNNLIIWVMIGFLSVIKQQTYIDKNEE